ncbi:hypothetical protein AB0J63_08750 [Streptosporangium canum]|uniref:caspase, EACC1-associated type n=1 Tax=Streptosporangium canum TaxID=324952 RepID=UPI00344989AF
MLGDREGARALLIGTGTHRQGSGLADVPAVGRTLDALRKALRTRCGLPDEAITVVLNPKTMAEMGEAVAAAVDAASDPGNRAPLLLFYVGHGLVSSTGGLYLATAGTDQRGNRLEHTALPYATVRRYLLDSAARPIVVILDCCFSGRALHSLTAPEEELAGMSEVAGGFVLTSAGRGQLALAPDGAEHTAFSGALLRVLEKGIEDGPRSLTLNSVFRHLSHVLPAAGLPRPHARASGRAGELALAENPAQRVHPHETAPAPAAGDQPIDGPPYLGLAAFRVQHAELFFGRERMTGELSRHLAATYDHQQPLVVTGASGSGKSSLLQAGLIPAIRRGALEIRGSAGWPLVLLTPGEHPVTALAAQLAELAGEPVDLLAVDILADHRAAAQTVRQALADHYRTGMTLIVDQFEEVFTQCTDESERRAFIRALHGLTQGARRTLVVISVRADFFHRCASHQELRNALQGSFVVGSMSRDEVRNAISGPAVARNLIVEPDLMDRLLSDLQADDELAGLPLLSHALLATWQERDGERLTMAGYLRTGGVHGALAATADRVYRSLPDETVRESARRIMLRLVKIGEEVPDSRQRVSLTRLMADLPDSAKSQMVLDAFAADTARLITLDDDQVEITHEALLRAWPTLREWIEVDRAGLLVEQHLIEAAYSWEAGDRETASLYRGNRLTLAMDRAAEHGERLPSIAKDFLAASVANDEAERRAARRRRVVRLYATAVLAVLVVIASAAAWIARANQLKAEAQTRSAVSRGLVLDAEARRFSEPGAALRLAVAAWHLDPSVTARDKLVSLLVDNRYRGSLPDYNGLGAAVALSDDARIAFVAVKDNTAALWDVSKPQAPVRLGTLPAQAARVRPLALSGDGRTAVTVSEGHVRLWDVSVPAAPAERSVLPRARADDAQHIAFSADGKTLLTSMWNGETVIWDVEVADDPRRVGELPSLDKSGGFVSAVAVSPDGRFAVTGWVSNRAAMWDLTDPTDPVRLDSLPSSPQAGAASEILSVAVVGKTAVLSNSAGARVWVPGASPVPLPGQTRTVSAVALSRDGKTALTASDDGTTLVWDVSTPRKPVPRVTLKGHANRIGATALSADGTRVLTGDVDGNLLLWDTFSPRTSTRLVASSPQPDSVSNVALNSDGRRALIETDSETVRVWEPRVSDTLRDGVTYRRANCCELALTADGSIAAIATDRGPPTLWNVPATGPLAQRGSLPSDVTGVRAIALSADGRRLALGTDAKTVEIWDVAVPDSPRRASVLTGHATAVYSVALSADGTTLLSDDASGVAKAWDLRDLAAPKLKTTLSNGSDSIDSLALSRDGNVALATTRSGAAVWDLRRPAEVGTLKSDIQVNVISLSADGRVALLGGNNDTAEMWDLTNPETPQMLWTVAGSKSVTVNAIALSADGSTALVGNSDRSAIRQTGTGAEAGTATGTARMWDLRGLVEIAADPLAHACALLGEGLSRQDWPPGVEYEATC